MKGVSVGVKRSGDTVQISLMCQGDYHAIEVFDRLVQGVQKGEITIGLKTTEAQTVPPIA